MVEVRKPKTVTLYESQITAVKKFADEHFDGDFSQGLRKIVKLWSEK